MSALPISLPPSPPVKVMTFILSFFAAATAGITFRLSLYVWLAVSIRGPIMRLLEFIRIYQVPATVVLVIGIGTYQLYKRRRRSSQGA